MAVTKKRSDKKSKTSATKEDGKTKRKNQILVNKKLVTVRRMKKSVESLKKDKYDLSKYDKYLYASVLDPKNVIDYKALMHLSNEQSKELRDVDREDKGSKQIIADIKKKYKKLKEQLPYYTRVKELNSGVRTSGSKLLQTVDQEFQDRVNESISNYLTHNKVKTISVKILNKIVSCYPSEIASKLQKAGNDAVFHFTAKRS